MGLTVPEDNCGAGFRKAENVPLGPVTGINWQSTGGLGTGTATTGVAFLGRSLSGFFGEQVCAATGRPACWPLPVAREPPDVCRQGSQDAEVGLSEVSARRGSCTASECPRSCAPPCLLLESCCSRAWAAQWAGAGLSPVWRITLVTTALQGTPGAGSAGSGCRPGKAPPAALLSTLAAAAGDGGTARTARALEPATWEGTGVRADGSTRSGL